MLSSFAYAAVPPGANWRWGISYRTGGASKVPYKSNNLGLHVGDDPAAVKMNRLNLMRAVAASQQTCWFNLSQVHGKHIHVIDEPPKPELLSKQEYLLNTNEVMEGDAILCRAPNWLLAVLVADCVPVLLVDPVASVFVTVHAGWKGTRLHIVRQAVDKAVAFGAVAERMHGFLGPAIGPCCFEVGQDVLDALSCAYPEVIYNASSQQKNGAKSTIDLWALNMHDMLQARIQRSNITFMRECTACNTHKYFSYRKENGKSGRFAAFIWTGSESP